MTDKAKQLALSIVSLIVIALYIAGMVLMICGQPQNGITLWVFSTVVGALILYIRSKLAKKKADAEAEEAEELEYQRQKGARD